ncbi:hypothetical protein ANASTE_00715 [Anaerofustis stercorihominis DSM 17244]|uniref:Uncharacterized protein n=1 Tax=Anaerofustis stercorihominis DSM 17244 TaxID=445971 RepID=B1C7L3_9FIRM|nr:hypothetical protein [Anaerofustis stercorihominis]EDS73000.1 hypothetical protein ANASTE_00715 [Anaerofustis stercorihominis DSM 17244]
MNANLIIISILIYGTVSLLTVLFSYNLGLRNGREIREEKEVSRIVEDKGKRVKMSKEEKKEMDLINTALMNIDNYDGTNRGQRKIG